MNRFMAIITALFYVQFCWGQSSGRTPVELPPIAGAEEGPSIPPMVPGTETGPQPDPEKPEPAPKPNPAPAPPKVGRPSQQLACPLIDNDVYRNMLATVSRLEDALKVTPECQTEASYKQLEKYHETLRQSVAPIQEYWANPTADPAALVGLESAVIGATTSLSSIGEILNSNALVNSRCGGELVSASDYVVAFSDLVVSLAPFAILASINFTAGLTTAWVAGTVGIAVMIKSLASALKDDSLQMSNTKHREVFLKSICEYKNIEQRMNIIQLASSGKIQDLEKQYETASKRVDLLSENQVSLMNQLVKDAQGFNFLRKLLNEASNQRILVQKIAQTFQKMDQTTACEYSQVLLGEYPDPLSNLTVRGEPLIKFKELFDRVEFDAFSRSAGRAKTAVLDSKLATPAEIRACQANASSYLTTVDRAIDAIETEAQRQIDSASYSLRDNEGFSDLTDSLKEAAILKESLGTIIEVVGALGRDSTSVSRSELHDRMNSVKEVLFQPSRTIGGHKIWGGPHSLVQKYLAHVLALSHDASKRFQSNFSGMVTELINVALTDLYLELERNPIPPEQFTGFHQIAELEFQAIRSAETLEVLKHPRYTVGNPQWLLACRRLEGLWIDSIAALDHLGAAENFCTYIDPMLNSNVHKDTLNTCRGRGGLGDYASQSDIKKRATKLEQRGFQENRAKVSQALTDLKCYDQEAG